MERVEEEEEKGTESSSPPPPSLSQLPGWPATDNKTRAEEHLLLRLKKRIKERSHRDPVFDLMILSHSFNRAHGHSHLPCYTEEKRKTLLEMINLNSAER